MKVFQTDCRPGILSFTNYERIDEDKLYQKIAERLKANPSVSFGEKITGPNEEILECHIDGFSFDLVNDLDYGAEIHSKSQEAIQKLSEYFGTV